eukprot:11052562-Ditylum_brightwellii.AAC.1
MRDFSSLLPFSFAPVDSPDSEGLPTHAPHMVSTPPSSTGLQSVSASSPNGMLRWGSAAETCKKALDCLAAT